MSCTNPKKNIKIDQIRRHQLQYSAGDGIRTHERLRRLSIKETSTRPDLESGA